MRAVWFIHGKTLRRELRFWLAITGYDLNDRSSSNRIYLLYLVLFFSIWGLTVLALITSAVAQLLTSLYPAHPYQAAVQMAIVALLAWWLWRLYGAARHCPIHFTNEDATLICSTPVSRPAVTFAWLLGEWFSSALPFWALAVTLGFVRAEIALGGHPGWPDAPLYLKDGFTFLAPVIGLHAGLYTLAWALGSYRLRGSMEVRGVLYAPLVAGVWLAPGVILGGQGIFPLLSLPFTLPVTSAAGLSGALAGSLTGWTWAAVGLVTLYLASRQLNLARAAQESTASPGATILSGQPAAAARLKRRLKSGSPPSSLPARPGAWALVWKQAVRQVRSFGLESLGHWLLLFLLSLGVWVAPDWGSRGVALLFWTSRVHGLSVEDLRADLGLWFPGQSLPLPPGRRLLAELVPAVALVTLLGWLALGAASLVGLRAIPADLALLVPLLAFDLAFSAGLDVVRQTRAEHLMMGDAPSSGMLSMVISALVIGLSVLVIVFFQGSPLGLGIAMVFAGLAGYALLTFAAESYRDVGR